MTQIKGDLGGLKDQIIAQGKERCREILEKTKAEAQKIYEAAEEESQAYFAEIIEQTREKALVKQSQMLTVAKLKSRKEVLAAKREALGQAFEEALAAFGKLPAKEYQLFFRALLVASKEERCEQIVISAEETRITPQFLAELSQELQWKLDLVQEEQEKLAKGGFLLRGPRLEIDCSLPTILSLIRPQLEGDVAQILFGEL